MQCYQSPGGGIFKKIFYLVATDSNVFDCSNFEPEHGRARICFRLYSKWIIQSIISTMNPEQTWLISWTDLNSPILYDQYNIYHVNYGFWKQYKTKGLSYKLNDIEKAQNDHLMSKKNLKSSDLSVIIPDYPTQHLSNFILKLFKWFKWFQFKPRFKKWRELPWKNSNRTVTYRNSCQMTSTSCDEFSGLNSRADFLWEIFL